MTLPLLTVEILFLTTFRRRRYRLWDQSILHASAWSPNLYCEGIPVAMFSFFWCRICGCSIPRCVHPLIACCLVSKSLWEAVLWFEIELATQLELEIAMNDVTERNLTPRKGKR